MFTQRDIAEQHGLTTAAVSKALRGARDMSPETIRRVRETARKLGYRPNRLVHALRSGRTNTVALIVPTLSIAYFARLAHSVVSEAKRHGYHVVISEVVAGLEDEAAEIETLLERRVDGFILVPRSDPRNRENYRRLIGQRIPLVFVDEYCPDVPCPAIVGSDDAGMRRITRHLIESGHRRIAYLDMGLAGVLHLDDRLNGYRGALVDAELESPEAYVVYGDVARASGLCGGARGATALVCATDDLAVDAIERALVRGLRVPGDLAVTGFSDYLPYPEFLRVPLTSARMDLDAMGRLAMRRFLSEVKSVSASHSVTRVGVEIAIRASSAGLAAKGLKRKERT